MCVCGGVGGAWISLGMGTRIAFVVDWVWVGMGRGGIIWEREGRERKKRDAWNNGALKGNVKS